MSQTQFCGYGRTLEEALTAASEEAIKSWKPGGPDDMARIKVESLSVLYGGIIGHIGTRVACVSLGGRAPAALAASSTPSSKPDLTLKLDVLPDVVYANLMPPVRRPQPHKIGLVLSVANAGSAPFQGQSSDSGVARFWILRGRTEIWKWPEFVAQVVTPVVIQPGESKTYVATWEMHDAVDLVNADLHAVARFVPSGDSAVHRIEVKPAY